MTDLFATASLVGGIFGKGGGRELAEAQLLDASRTLRCQEGPTLWQQFAAFDDPDAPTTVKGTRFPYQTQPEKRAPGAEEPPDPGSFKALRCRPRRRRRPPPAACCPGATCRCPPAASVPGAPSLPGSPSLPAPPSLPGGLGLPELGPLPKAMSNALLVSGANSASGHPLAVFGPQVAYFAPQILMEEDLHGPGIDARGAAFPGVNLYVQLGHGRDYAWSATSAGQDIIDTFAVPLCDATHYRFRGQCLAIEKLDRKNAWTPNLADQTPAGAETLHAERTKLGLVAGRGTYKGRKMLYTVLRSTYQHEVDSAIGFSLFNEPGTIRSPQDFQRAAGNIGYTFNWFYIDAKHIAYFNSATTRCGRRGRPASCRWRRRRSGATTTRTSTRRATRRSPSTRRSSTSRCSRAGTTARPPATRRRLEPFSSVFRSQMLDRQLALRLKGGHKLTLPEMVDAMEQAGTTDLRGMTSLPLALRVLGRPKDPALAAAVAKLKAWSARRHAPHRPQPRRHLRRRRCGADHGRLVAKLIRAMFQPVMGKGLLDRLEATYQIDNTPNNEGDHLGSAYQEGFYGYVLKDLKRVLSVRWPRSTPPPSAGAADWTRAARPSRRR